MYFGDTSAKIWTVTKLTEWKRKYVNVIYKLISFYIRSQNASNENVYLLVNTVYIYIYIISIVLKSRMHLTLSPWCIIISLSFPATRTFLCVVRSVHWQLVTNILRFFRFKEKWYSQFVGVRKHTRTRSV